MITLLTLTLCAPLAALAGGVPSDLVGAWCGTARDGIELRFTVNSDGTGRYSFTQSGYQESYDFTMEGSASTFTVAVPANNQLGISTCGGTYAFQDGTLTLNITTSFATGRQFQYTATCTKEELKEEEATLNGTYLWNENPEYAITLLVDACKLSFGSNVISADCVTQTDGTLLMTNAGPFFQVDLTAVPAQGQLLVSGNLLLKNASGSLSSLSLQDLDSAVFTLKQPFNIEQIAGSFWRMSQVRRVGNQSPFTNYTELSFAQDGSGSMGDWFTGQFAFTYTVEQDAVKMVFPIQNVNATATLIDNQLVVDFGSVIVNYLESR